ncbi:MAG: putative beta-lactamase [Bacteroidetes bacterium HLUCCA01]|nr:MAG: putative beta-lactamase [Bacteroidetes bacterium HLUCCA01]
MKITCCLFILLTLQLTACTPADPSQPLTPDQTTTLDRGLEQIAADFELMGLAVVYIQDFQVAYEGYTGLAVRETQTPLDANSVVRIASPSKSLTAMALMQLYEQGLVDLDADVSRYLGWELRSPHWPDEPVTLRMLLGHTSGIADGPTYSAFARTMIAERLPLRMLFTGTDGTRRWSGYSPDIFSEHCPGTYFSYSNAAWGLIASVIERVSGQRFDLYARSHLFEPLGVEASFNITDIRPEHIAALYRFQNDAWTPQIDFYADAPPADRGYEGYEPGHNGLIYAPQGGLRISTRGLITLADVLLNQGQTTFSTPQPVRILQAETLREMMAENWRYDGSNGDTWDDFWRSFGLGLHRLTGEPGKDVIFVGVPMTGHPGIAYGLLSDVYVDPATGTGVIFMTNGSKQPFAYGETSFYQVEEAVFQLLETVKE